MYLCPVCGYPELKEPADMGDQFCPSCGFQFGITDDDLGFTYEQWRQQWIEGGMMWWSPSRQPPELWNPVVQLLRIGVSIQR